MGGDLGESPVSLVAPKSGKLPWVSVRSAIIQLFRVAGRLTLSLRIEGGEVCDPQVQIAIRVQVEERGGT